MNNLILSTRYRLIKARVLYYCLFFYSILLPICLSIQGIDSAHDESGNKIEFTGIIAYKMMGDQMIMFTYVTLILFLCIAIGKDFNNKTIYYEIMSGYSREKIVFSRLRVFIPISIILIIIASFIYVLVPTLLNGFYSDVLDYISIKEFIIRIIFNNIYKIHNYNNMSYFYM